MQEIEGAAAGAPVRTLPDRRVRDRGVTLRSPAFRERTPMIFREASLVPTTAPQDLSMRYRNEQGALDNDVKSRDATQRNPRFADEIALGFDPQNNRI